MSEYTYEQSVSDGVNVPYDVYSIETEISTKGDTVKAGWYIDRRDKLSRESRWQVEEEDTEYGKNDLDKKVVNISQIRTIIKEFKRALEEEIFPNRRDENGEYEVPKTLIFAKTDSHADDIIKIVREVFEEKNEFCKKVTYTIDENPKSLLNKFRNSYYPRIAVTVDMIATGTDVKPLEVLLFMRDVRNINYFEQMKGRGTRTIDHDKLQEVSRTARHKTHFVIVDAVGATKSKKTDSRPLERKPSVPLKDLLGAITMGVRDEDLFLSLANRLIRLEKQITEKEKEKILEYSNGKSLIQITKELLSAYEPDEIERLSIEKIKLIPIEKRTPEDIDKAKTEAQNELIEITASTFNGELNDYLENIRKEHEQIIDHVNIDSVSISEWNSFTIEKANETIRSFSQYLEENKDEIKALSIYYNQPYNRRMVSFNMMKDVLDKIKLEKPSLAPYYVWEAYATIERTQKGKEISHTPINELTALVSLIRHVCGIDNNLTAFDKTVSENFQKWMFKQNAGQHNRFSEE